MTLRSSRSRSIRFTLTCAACLAFLAACKSDEKKAEPDAASAAKVADTQGHPHDRAPAGAASHAGRAASSPHGASPHGAGPHGASPHGAANPHGASGAKMGAAAGPEVALDWEAPKEWKKEERVRPMRAATYEVPGESGRAELAVFYFGPNQGGDVESNIQRWIAQFQGAPAESVKRGSSEVNGMKVHTVTIPSGTFASGMPGGAQGPQEGWGLEGAIVLAPSGSYFFKLTGPAATVAGAADGFKSLISSAKPKGD